MLIDCSLADPGCHQVISAVSACECEQLFVVNRHEGGF